MVCTVHTTYCFTCRLRATTWERLQLVRRGILAQVLQTILNNDPISPVLDKSHYVSVDRRLENVVKIVETCSKLHGKDYVFVKDTRSWQPLNSRHL